ncbi:putative reverse transcriptase domain-containing protein [Tanacetum coccineum]
MPPESDQAMIDQALQRNSTNGDASHSSHGDDRRNVQTARPCFYTDFMKCQPLNFKGTEGVVSLTRWIEKMESVFNISGCAIENQVKFATCTLLGDALTWWNCQIRTLGPEAYSMTWESARPTSLDEILSLANDLMDLKLALSGRKLTKQNEGCTNSSRKQTWLSTKQPSRDRMSTWSTTWGRVKRSHAVDLCPSAPSAIFITMRDNKAIPKGNGCFECGASGHFKRDFGNAEKNGNTSRNPDSNVVTGTFLLNNRYASILFDTGADRSFISTAFSSLIDIALIPLENSYDIKLADEKIAQEYMAKGCQIFLAQISAKKEEHKSEGKQLKDVPIV